MDKHTAPADHDLTSLAEDARALMAATVDVAGERVNEARNRLAAALDRGSKIFGRAREKAAEGVKAADGMVHEHPYQALGIAFGVGAIVGSLLARRCSRCSE